jgi:hypothetical protein
MEYRVAERLHGELLKKYSAAVQLKDNGAIDLPSFRDKLAAVTDFLPDETFLTLRSRAEQLSEALRVNIPLHKRGSTISYLDLHYRAPDIVAFYLSPGLRRWCSHIVGEPVSPTPVYDQSSCSLLVYDQPNDHIGWHRDLNFYKGRHFTVLLSLVNHDCRGQGTSSANLVVRLGKSEFVVPTPPNALVIFEGVRVNHCVTPLGEAERRIILSMTFCTKPESTPLLDLSRRVKDIAYYGIRALWT